MTSRGTKMRACAGKKAHPQQRAALAHLRQLVRAGACASSLRAYHCRHCGAWHVGHWSQHRRHP